MNLLKKPWFLLFLLIPFLRPAILDGLSYLGELPHVSVLGLRISVIEVFNAWRLISIIIILVLYYMYGKINKIIISVVLYLVSLFVATVYNNGSFNGNFFRYFTFAATVMGICLLINLLASTNLRGLLRVLYCYLGLLFTINFISIIILSGGVDRGWDGAVYFLGNRNPMSVILIFTALITCVYSHVKKNRLSAWAYTVCVAVVISVIQVWSAMGVVMGVLFIFIVLIGRNKVFKKVLNVNVFLLVNVFLFFIITIFRAQEHFAFLIEQVLNRSLTMTTRTYLWDITLERIRYAPWLGYGLSDDSWILMDGGLFHAHNIIFELIMRGGLITLISYLCIVLCCRKTLSIHKNHNISLFFGAAIFVFFVGSLATSFIHDINVNIFFITFILSFHVDKIIALQEQESNGQ
ncbi:MAG: hypothetical protein FWF78_10510 [Defluviitaleaceae bacterium]|nr:hypothetical protein [Defluviitaleaceae bacterium]